MANGWQIHVIDNDINRSELIRIADNKIIKYMSLLKQRCSLNKEIELISYVLLSISLSTDGKSALLK